MTKKITGVRGKPGRPALPLKTRLANRRRRRRPTSGPNPFGSQFKSDAFFHQVTQGILDFKDEDPATVGKLRKMLRDIADSDEIWDSISDSVAAAQRFRDAAKVIKI